MLWWGEARGLRGVALTSHPTNPSADHESTSFVHVVVRHCDAGALINTNALSVSALRI